MQDASFGSYLAPAWCRFIISICQRIPMRSWLGKRLAFVLRKPVLLRKQSPVDVLVQGVRFRLQPQCNLSDKRLLCTPDLLDGVEREFFIDQLGSGSVLLDVGANIGGYGLLLAMARPDIKVLGVEADPRLARRLKQHIKFNNLAGRCSCLEAAASPDFGKVRLYLDSVNQGCNSLLNEGTRSLDDEEGSVEVDGLPLQEIIKQAGLDKVDLLKMDIEGYEFPVLENFFAQSESGTWPQYIQLEQYQKDDDNAAVRLAIRNGYEKVFQTRMNAILKKALDR